MQTIYKNKKELIHTLIHPDDVVLDVGFWGQGVGAKDPNWVHKLLKEKASEVYGIDLDYDPVAVGPSSNYVRGSAENFSLPRSFDVVFAGDLIEHLSNPGLFLERARNHLKDDGRLILTTPNTFNLFNITEKFTKQEPTVNSDHTAYFNTKTLSTLLAKNGFEVVSVGGVYSLGLSHKESFKKKFLNGVYFLLSRLTPKFIETLVVVAKKKL